MSIKIGYTKAEQLRKRLFHVHKMSKWEDIESGGLERGGQNVGNYVIQESTCLECGAKKLRTVKVYV